MKKILIRVITYNQENVISRALDSVLCQKEWGLYRIVVSDDCSKDHTWDILQKYKAKFPEIMDIHRNEHNLGIYGNVEKSEEYVRAIDFDLFGGLSGDDAYCDGYFQSVQTFIKDNNIDTNEAVGIYSDWKSVSPEGKEYVFKQDAAISGHRLWSLKARGKIYGRSLMVSKMTREGYEDMLHGKGLSLTETHYDSQPHLNIRKAYYLPQVTSAYYTGIGVSTQLSDKGKSDYYTNQSAETWNYCLNHYAKDDCDRHYIKYRIVRAEYFTKPSLKRFFKMLHHFVKGQLPGCKEPFMSSVRLFGYYLYRLLFK